MKEKKQAENMQQSFDGKENLETVMKRFIQNIISIIDDRIEKRFNQEDILRAYNAKIISVNITEKASGTVDVSDTTTAKTKEVTSSFADSITVEYNDYQYKNISCCFGDMFDSKDIGKYVKIGTYDGDNYYILHRL